MTQPHLQLAVEQQQSWTDQLILLNRVYQATLTEIRTARKHQKAEDTAATAKAILRAQRLILEIVAGLDPSYGTIPEQVEQLCFFCLQCLDQRTTEDLQAAEHVLTILAEGFSGIVDEVRSLEAAGQLPQREADRGLVNHVI